MFKFIKKLVFPSLYQALLITFIFTILILIGTLTPLPQKIDAPGSDKWHHFIAFALLTYPMAASHKRLGIAVFIFGICLGASIEIIQPFVNRYGDIMDFRADVIGVCIGYSCGLISNKYNKQY